MSHADEIVQAMTKVVAETGPFAPAVLFFATSVEYVFPPFPGDLLLVLGAWYAAKGQLSWPATFLWVTAGALAGASINYGIGVWIGRRVAHRAEEGGHPLAAKLELFEASYRRWGGWLLVFNRFMPGIRAFLFVAAGASGIPLGRVLLLGGISACAWNGLMLAAGAFVARNVDELVHLFQTYTNVAGGVLAAAGIFLLARAVVRRRSAARGRP